MEQATFQNDKFRRMTESPIPSLIGRLSVPTVVSMLVTSIYNMADTFFVGKLGISATGAVGVVFSLMAIIQAIGFMFGHGSGNYISRKLGAQDWEGASQMASTGFFSAFGAGLLVMILGLCFLEPMVKGLGATDTILPFAREYARLILIGAPYMTASLVLNNQLRFQGSAFYGMCGIASGAVINIGLDPLFIFVFDMGISGAALATIISQLISFGILLLGCSRGGNLRIRWKHFSPSITLYKEMIRGGLPSLCRQGLGSAATICLNLAAHPFGDPAIAAMSIVSRITMFASSALLGFGQGFQPVCGFNYGARLFSRVRRAFWFCVKVSFCALIFIAVSGFIFAPQLIAVFQNDEKVIEIGSWALRLQCITFPLMAWVILDNMMLQTIAKAMPATILAAARQGLFFLPCIWLLPPLFGIFGIQMSQPIADLCTFFLSLPMGIHTLQEMKQMEGSGANISSQTFITEATDSETTN